VGTYILKGHTKITTATQQYSEAYTQQHKKHSTSKTKAEYEKTKSDY
jgi:hypothetical protein